MSPSLYTSSFDRGRIIRAVEMFILFDVLFFLFLAVMLSPQTSLQQPDLPFSLLLLLELQEKMSEPVPIKFPCS